MKIKRVYAKKGTWWYVDLQRKWHRLCRVSEGESALHRALADLFDDDKPTMANLADEWKRKKLGRYSFGVRKEYERSADLIAKAFAEYRVGDVRPVDVNVFIADNFSSKPNTAKKFAARLSSMFRFAIGKGWRDTNPCDGFDPGEYETPSRTLLPTLAQVARIRKAALTGDDDKPTISGEMFCCLVDMSYLVWQRAKDIRTLTDFQVGEKSIHFLPSKTAKTSGRSVEIAITPAIRDVLARAARIKVQREIISTYVFPTSSGSAYTKSGLNSMWIRARARAKITADIQFRDLRALGATNARKAGVPITDIQARLVHASSRTSEIYLKERTPEWSSIAIDLEWPSIDN